MLEDFGNWSDEKLLDYIGKSTPGSNAYKAAEFEYNRRRGEQGERRARHAELRANIALGVSILSILITALKGVF